ncbi:MAG: tripartite tricarboxylate transporter substrate binding protein [Proteobacteria bacterium]|nr:tripartite tricarboxylate transporter substrate binding protein [Pseudomonadota bacterium]
MKLRNVFYAFAGVAAIYSVAHAADNYPSRPIRIIVPSPPGGGNDIMARIGAQRLSEAWSRPVIVDNRPGAGGAIAFELVARAEPDGYTLLLGSTNLTVLPDITTVAYDPIKSFAPISLMTTSMNILLVHPGVAAESTKELIALAKARPGQLLFASSSVATSSHLAAELFCLQAGVKMVHVPYKGAGPAITELMGGQVHMLFANPAASIAHVKSGKLRALAVSGDKRSVIMPEVPTVAEAAIPGFEASTWWGILAPARTPDALIAKLNAELARSLTQSDALNRIAALGADVVGGPPQKLADHLRAEIPKWGRVVRAGNIKL